MVQRPRTPVRADCLSILPTLEVLFVPSQRTGLRDDSRPTPGGQAVVAVLAGLAIVLHLSASLERGWLDGDETLEDMVRCHG